MTCPGPLQTSVHAAAPQSAVGTLAEGMSLQVAASQSTEGSQSARELVKQLLWMHSLRGVAGGEADCPAPASRPLASPHGHLNARLSSPSRGGSLRTCPGPSSTAASAKHASTLLAHLCVALWRVSMPVAASKSTEGALAVPRLLCSALFLPLRSLRTGPRAAAESPKDSGAISTCCR